MAENKASKTSILDKIKALFADTLPTTYKLADGTDVTISLLDVGGDFTIGGVPAPEGTYTLMDGSNVVVDSTGKITSVDDPSQFADTEYTLADGTKCTIDKLEVGGKVMQGDQAAPDGDLKLEDGRVISVQSGLITVVKPAEGAPPPAPEAMTKEQIIQAYDDIVAAPAGDQVGKLTSCVKALMDYCFGWQIDNAPSPQEAVQDAQNVADAIAAYVTLKAQFTKDQGEIATMKIELASTKDTLKQALQLMTQLAELPGEDVPEGIKRKVIFSGMDKKAKGLDKYKIAAAKLAEQNSN